LSETALVTELLIASVLAAVGGLAVAVLADHRLDARRWSVRLVRTERPLGRFARVAACAGAAALMGACLVALDATPGAAMAMAVALVALLASALYDLREHYIDIGLLGAALAIALVARGAEQSVLGDSFGRPLVWAAVAAAPLGLLWLFSLVFDRWAPGPIDPDTGRPTPWLSVWDIVPWLLIGAAFGPRIALGALVAGLVAGGLWAAAGIAYNIVRRHSARQVPMPMVPSFAIGLVVVILTSPAA
jgi:hypothetical protein